jgi:hypothetical protein
MIFIGNNILYEDDKNHQLSDEQIKILEEELVAYGKNPDEGSSWEEIKERILKKK